MKYNRKTISKFISIMLMICLVFGSFATVNSEVLNIKAGLDIQGSANSSSFTNSITVRPGDTFTVSVRLSADFVIGTESVMAGLNIPLAYEATDTYFLADGENGSVNITPGSIVKESTALSVDPIKMEDAEHMIAINYYVMDKNLAIDTNGELCQLTYTVASTAPDGTYIMKPTAKLSANAYPKVLTDPVNTMDLFDFMSIKELKIVVNRSYVPPTPTTTTAPPSTSPTATASATPSPSPTPTSTSSGGNPSGSTGGDHTTPPTATPSLSVSPTATPDETETPGAQTTPPVETTAPTETPAPTATIEKSFSKGYDDGSFRPDNKLTRGEAAQIIYNLYADPESAEEYSADFSDLPSTHWAYKAVAFANTKNYFIGYEDGTFRVDNNITRAEMATLIDRLNEKQLEELENKFPDTEGHWGQGYINVAFANGYVKGYEDGSFKPDNNVTRAECVTIFHNALARHEEWTGNISLNDIDGHWAYKYIMNAVNGYEG